MEETPGVAEDDAGDAAADDTEDTDDAGDTADADDAADDDDDDDADGESDYGDIDTDPEIEGGDDAEDEYELERDAAVGTEPVTAATKEYDRVREADHHRHDEDEDEDDEDRVRERPRRGRKARAPRSEAKTDSKAPGSSRRSQSARGTTSRPATAGIAPVRFTRESVGELRKVLWPSRTELVTYSIVVIVFLVIMIAIVAGLDVGFARLVLLVFG